MNWTMVILAVAIFVVLLLVKRAAFVPADVAKRHLAQGALVIDVRSPEEFRNGHLPSAVNIPLDELGETLPRRVKDKSQVLLLHCLSGGRSAMAKSQLKRLGYANAFNLGSYGRARKIVGQTGRS